MLCIFLWEISMLCWDFPIDTEGIIEDADTTIGFRMIEVITLVLEDGGLGEDGEAVGKILRDKELKTDDWLLIIHTLYIFSGVHLATQVPDYLSSSLRMNLCFILTTAKFIELRSTFSRHGND